ncbi:hypothetical protein C8Q79DRAFT_1033308 [Trametes meyenii]|nr:hypothetical protein C8Q79DRAFT_1033308 [Trametes meyenii]
MYASANSEHPNFARSRSSSDDGHTDILDYQDDSDAYASDRIHLPPSSDSELPPTSDSEPGDLAKYQASYDDDDLQPSLPPSRPDITYLGKSSPILYKTSSIKLHEVTVVGPHKLANSRYQLDNEMAGLWLEIDVETFMKKLVPGDDFPSKDVDSLPKFKVTVDKKEVDMYPGIVEGLRTTLKAVGCTDLLAYRCDSHGDKAKGSRQTGDRNALKPDIAIYPTSIEARAAYNLSRDSAPNPKRTTAIPVPSPLPDLANSTLSISDSTLLQEQVEEDLPASVAASHNVDAEAGATSGPLTGDDELADILARTIWAWAEVLIEVKAKDSSAPFAATVKEGSEGVLPWGKARMQARGQASQYGLEIFNRQHRQHLFMLSIVRDTARIIYLDRCAAVVSHPFNYVNDPSILVTFLYRFSRMTPAQRGHDPTVSRATKAEDTMFRRLWETYSDSENSAEALALIKRDLKHAATEHWPIYVLDVYERWAPSSDEPDATPTSILRADSQRSHHRCLVGRPHRMAGSMTGRGTRGFVAYDLEEKRVVYIKDFWRAVSKYIPSERDNYERLYHSLEDPLLDAAAVGEYFLTLRAGGDVIWAPEAEGNSSEGNPMAVEIQETRAQNFFVNTHDAEPPLVRRHHRLVFKEVCGSLEEFKSARDLVTVVMHALFAHAHAWESAKLLHRDISSGNILICYSSGDVRGILADWDLAKGAELLADQKATQPSRSGTWQFMSALRQCYPETPYRLADDLESFVHVLNWCTLKYLRHSGSGNHEKADAPNDHDTARYKHHPKFSGILLGTPFVTVLPLHDNPLANLLQGLAKLCKQHYESDVIKSIWYVDKLTRTTNLENEVGGTSGVKARRVFRRFIRKPWGTRLPTSSPRESKVAPPLSSTPKESPFNTHEDVMQLFFEAFHAKEWPNIEKLPNQVPEFELFVPTSTGISSGSRGSASSKRVRMDTAAEEPPESSENTSSRPVVEHRLRTRGSGSRQRGRSGSPRAVVGQPDADPSGLSGSLVSSVPSMAVTGSTTVFFEPELRSLAQSSVAGALVSANPSVDTTTGAGSSAGAKGKRKAIVLSDYEA